MTLATNIQTVIDSGSQINEAFPIAGQDNNTQGFRDNFSKTQTGLVAAGNALDAINTNTPKLDSDNNFANVGSIENAKFVGSTGLTSNVTVSVDSQVDVDASTSEYFRIKLNSSCSSLNLGGWPNVSGTKLYRKVRLEFFSPSGLPYTVKFTSPVYATIKYDNVGMFDPNGVGLSVGGEMGTSSVIVEAWVSDNSTDSITGKALYLQYIGTFTEA